MAANGTDAKPLATLFEERKAKRAAMQEKLDALAAAEAAAVLAHAADDASADGDEGSASSPPSPVASAASKPHSPSQTLSRPPPSASSALKHVIRIPPGHAAPAPTLLRRYDAHAEHVSAALAAVVSAQEAEEFALKAALKRLKRRRMLRHGMGDAFPVDPSRHLYVPSKACDALDDDEARGARVAAARARLYQRPTLTLPTTMKALLAGRGERDLCAGAKQVFHDRFQFTVALPLPVWQRNVRRVFKGDAAAQAFDAMIRDRPPFTGTAASSEANDEANSESALADGLPFVDLQHGISRALDAVLPGMPLRVYLLMLTDKVRCSDLVRKATVPPPLTAGGLTLAQHEWQAKTNEFPAAEDGSVPQTLETAAAQLIEAYAQRFHPIVLHMLAVAKGDASPHANQTALGVPQFLAAYELGPHYPLWQAIVGSTEPQPVDVSPPPLAPETIVEGPESNGRSPNKKGSKRDAGGAKARAAACGPQWTEALCDASERNLARGEGASYFECFALLLLNCEALLRIALPCGVLSAPEVAGKNSKRR